MAMNILLELQYLPCIQYFSKLYNFNHVIIDDLEHFEKQSYRNRCIIAGANGPIDLIVPVYQSRRRLPIKEILIDNHIHWQHQHWQSIKSAYGKTAFFEHYAHKLEDIYSQPFANLFDFNLALLTVLLKILKVDTEQLKLLSEVAGAEYLDYKNKIHPKERFQAIDAHFVMVPYQQAFNERHGFLPNLSIIDLIFNEGPGAGEILRSSKKINIFD